MRTNILHISDLHLEDFKPKDNDLIKSRFQEKNFIDKFYSSIKKYCTKIDYIIITGDSANTGTSKEYSIVRDFLDIMIQELGVEKGQVLICPGNHDINWKKSQKAFHNAAANALNNEQEAPKENESYKFHHDKFEDFTEFYNDFYNDDNIKFDPLQAVYRDFTISINDNKIQICLVNSCFGESHYHDNHQGYIDHESFEKYLKESDDKILKVALLHHVPVVMNDTKSIKNWDEEIKYLCNKYNVRLFLFGHQHKSQGVKFKDGDIEFLQLSVGALCKNEQGVQNTFNFLEIEYHEDTSLFEVSKKPFQYIEHGDEPDWIPLDAKKVVEFLSYQKPPISEPTPVGILGEKKVVYKFPKRIELFSDKLLEIITNCNLFSSGHYHWNKTTRTLGFIDTYSLLANSKNSKVAKGGILELYNSHSLESEFIIGLGQEGNILGGFLAMNKGLHFTSVPYFSRKDDYSKHEKDLNINGSERITIVTDVVHGASSVINIIKDKVVSFENVKNIDLLSLFYISKENAYAPDMFKNLDSRLSFYTVSDKIKIDKCRCEDDKYESCSIFCKKLEKVHVFHS